jgi:hypothetical protein
MRLALTMTRHRATPVLGGENRPWCRQPTCAGSATAGIRFSLLRAYRDTCYQVDGIDVRIGRRSSDMDQALLSRGMREAAFITAYNPFSRVMPSGWNRRMQARLTEALRRRPILQGRGSWRRWSEAHLLVFGDSRPTSGLARRFRQYGIVVVRVRQPAGLLMTSLMA